MITGLVIDIYLRIILIKKKESSCGERVCPSVTYRQLYYLLNFCEKHCRNFLNTTLCCEREFLENWLSDSRTWCKVVNELDTHTFFISWSIVWNSVQKISAECCWLILRFVETSAVNAVCQLRVWMNFYPYVTLIVGFGCKSIQKMLPKCGWEFVNFVKFFFLFLWFRAS